MQAIYRDLTLTGAFSVTGAGNTIQSPWGSFPGYLSMIDQDFDRAREKAVLVGAAYDFSKALVTGPERQHQLRLGMGRHQSLDAEEGSRPGGVRLHRRLSASLPGARFLQGMWFRARAAILDQQDAKTLGYQFRIIINWDRDLI